MDMRPVGVFDSGLGGLTAVTAIRNLMPNEKIVYFGDTARCPYGTKTREELRMVVRDNLAVLEGCGVKAILAACGTMSAVCGDILSEAPVPVVNVLTPSVAAAASVPGDRPIAVIATEASIRSGAFAARLSKACTGRDIICAPCQDFVALCESGHVDPDDLQLKEAVERYLTPVRVAHPAALILGCTHFGIISEAISAFMGTDTALLSASECAAEDLRSMLESRGMLADCREGAGSDPVFLTSGDISEFENNARIILGEEIRAEKVRIV